MDPTRLIPYSPEVLYAVVRYHNEVIFPGQLGGAAFAITAFVAMLVGARWPRVCGRLAALMLALLWVQCAILWFAFQYAAINWAGPYLGIAFAIQALLILAFGVIGNGLKPDKTRPVARRWPALLLAALALGLYQVAGWAFGMPWSALPYTGTSPDPTVVFTLGLIALAGRASIVFWIIPILWLLFSIVWASLLGAPGSLVLPVVGLLAAGWMVVAARRPAR